MMDGKWQPASARSVNTSMCVGHGVCLLLALPVFVLHQVLGMLDPHDLLNLLQTSKAMAQEVMQHCAGRLSLRFQLQQTIHQAAFRRLLQWAPPACLKLILDSQQCCFFEYTSWEPVSSMFTSIQNAFGSHQCLVQQQVTSLHEVCIKGFSLPSLVPADLVMACPNLQTLHLQECVVTWTQQERCSNSTGCGVTNDSCCHNQDKVLLADLHPAQQLHTLVLEDVHAPGMFGSHFTFYEFLTIMPLDPRDVMQYAEQSQSTARYTAEQVSSSLPSVCCLKLLGGTNQDWCIQLLGPQLKELHVHEWQDLRDAKGLHAQLLQLQKLVTPHLVVTSAADMEFLLSLPNLTHIELNKIGLLSKDYSSAACKWQYLRLHMTTCNNPRVMAPRIPMQNLVALSKLPLHSLTQPLTLGHPQGCTMLVLPSSAEPEEFAALEHLGRQLMKCGVKLMSDILGWMGYRPEFAHHALHGGAPLGLMGQPPQFVHHALQQGAQLVPALVTIAQAFGQCSSIDLGYMTIDQPLLSAVAAVYQDSLEVLTLRSCKYTADMKPAWQAALSGLPALRRVELQRRYTGNAELLQCIRNLVAAMALQQTGRCIEVIGVVLDPYPQQQWFVTPQAVLEGAEELLAGVEVTAGDGRAMHIKRIQDTVTSAGYS